MTSFLYSLKRNLYSHNVYRIRYRDKLYFLSSSEGVIELQDSDGSDRQSFSSIEALLDGATICGGKLIEVWALAQTDIIRGSIDEMYSFSDFIHDLSMGREFDISYLGISFGVSHSNQGISLAQYGADTPPQEYINIDEFSRLAEINGRLLKDIWRQIIVEVIF